MFEGLFERFHRTGMGFLEESEVVVGGGHRGVLCPKNVDLDGEALLEELFRTFEVTLWHKKHSRKNLKHIGGSLRAWLSGSIPRA